MQQCNVDKHIRQSGFTLVELSIVLVVIGLILGGVLKGQEMIHSMQIKSTIKQIESIRAAVNLFEDRYFALPGDFADANQELGTVLSSGWDECDGTTACNGNGIVDGFNTGEGLLFWQHLAAAGFLTGIELGAAPVAAEGMLPAPAVGGVLTIWDNRGSATYGYPSGLWMELASNTGTDRFTGTLSSSDLQRIDRIYDDGKPGAGWVVSASANCHSGGSSPTLTSTYQANEKRCRAMFKIR